MMRPKTDSLPRIAFVGPILGGSEKSAHSQSYILSGLFEKSGYTSYRFSTSSNRYWRPIDIALSLLRHHRSIDMALIHVFSGNSFLIAEMASLICQFLKIPQIMVLHGGNLPRMIAKYPNWTKRVFQRATQIITPSNYLKSALTQIGIQAQVIPNVVELDNYPSRSIEQVRPVMLWMRSFSDLYNPLMAIHVLHRLRNRFPDARLLMAGPDRGMLTQTKELAQTLGVEDAVEWLGFIDHTQKLKAAQQADIYINTNTVDNMPVSLLEMAALGLPIVATCVGGIPYVWTDELNCLLVADDNPDEMVAAIQRLIHEPVLVQHLTEEALELVHEMSWTEVKSQWESLFQSILKTNFNESPAR